MLQLKKKTFSGSPPIILEWNPSPDHDLQGPALHLFTVLQPHWSVCSSLNPEAFSPSRAHLPACLENAGTLTFPDPTSHSAPGPLPLGAPSYLPKQNHGPVTLFHHTLLFSFIGIISCVSMCLYIFYLMPSFPLHCKFHEDRALALSRRLRTRIYV